MRSLFHPAPEDLQLSHVLFALSDPTRLHIVRALAERGEASCAGIELPLAKSSCSRHYKVLREAGIIQIQPDGTAYRNSLRKKDLNARFPGLLAAVLRAAPESTS